MRIAIYSRKSKETETGESINNQIKLCKDYFTRQYENCIFEIFEDEGFSGGNINRPSFQRMMKLARDKQFDIVCAYKIDRISRNTLDFLNMFEDLNNSNIKLVSVTEGFDPSTPTGKMMMSMLSNMAEMERMNIAQRVKDNMGELAKIGRWTGGTPPRGYKSITLQEGYKIATYLEAIEEEEPLIRKIFNLAYEGYSTYNISAKVNLSPKTIHNIIINPVYCSSTERSSDFLEQLGYIVYGELNGKGYMPYNRRSKKNNKRLYNAPDKFVSVSKHKGIVDDDIWIAANKNLMDRGTDAKPRISPNSFLAHIVKCKCGSGMFLHTGRTKNNGEKQFYFRCSAKKNLKSGCDSKWLSVGLVEEYVIDTLKTIKLDNKLLNNYISSTIPVDYDTLIKQLKKEITQKNNEILKLSDKLIYIEGPALSIISEKINSISSSIEELNNNIIDINSAKELNRNDKVNINNIPLYISKLVNSFDKIEIEDKQITIKNIIKEIKYNGIDEIEIILA